MLALVQGCVLASVLVDLSGEWTVSNLNKSIRVPGVVPGDVYTDLMRAGVIGDPYYRFNDDEYKWVGRDDWTYERSFTLENGLGASALLVAEGLDTVCDVHINNVHVLSADNMFRRWVVPLAPSLLAHNNSITVFFRSPVTYALHQNLTYPKPTPAGVPPSCRPPEWHGECHVNFIRKEQCSFSWDWGPSFPTQGIHLPIAIHTVDATVPSYIRANAVRHENGSWDLPVVVGLQSVAPDPASLLVTLKDSNGKVLTSSTLHVTPGGKEVAGTLYCSALDIKMWYPRGYGEAVLYTVSVGKLSKRVGFKTVKLVQDEIEGQQGRTFYYKVNGVPIFMKGTNWIPSDSFESRVTTDVLTDLFDSYTAANFNTLRVWGGGVYMKDEFYDIADERGILIWQEFMFACSMYPTDAAFMANIKQEVFDQVNRLQHHASIAVWSGNNENEAALLYEWYGTTDSQFYIDDYVSLYFDTVFDNVALLDTTRPHVISSPSNGDETRDNPVQNMWYNFTNGDIHHYEYASDCWDVTTYPNPRFASEYGVQSYSSFEEIALVTSAEDWTWNSSWMQHRQHLVPIDASLKDGNNIMKLQAEKHFNWPETYPDQLLMTQIQQAMCVKTQTEVYLRNKDTTKANTMGALYWQGNDIWPTVSWTSIEYGGRWKMLHYYAKRFFTPVLVSMYVTGDTYGVVVVSDNLQAETAVLKRELWSWDSVQPLASWEVNVSVPANNAAEVEKGNKNDLLERGGSACKSHADCFLIYSLHGGATVLSENWYLFGSPKHAKHLVDPGLRIVSVTGAGPFKITITGSRPAPFLWLSTGKNARLQKPSPLGTFSDNGFIYLPTMGDLSLTFTPQKAEAVTLSDLANSLQIKSLSSLQ